MALDNDIRGWILTCISAIACVFGSFIICVDLVVRLFPGKKGFKIEDSNGFLSCSLSLSAGVMLFSALYKMLPSSKESLQDGGLSPKAAAWVLIACFLGGVFGIQLLSRVIHHFMPSHVVDCDHTHEEEEETHNHSHQHPHRRTSHSQKSEPEDHEHGHHDHHHGGTAEHKPAANGNSESTPLLARSSSYDATNSRNDTAREISDAYRASPAELGTWTRAAGRPSIQARTLSTMSKLVSGSKMSCDADGPCFGYSDPCGQECFKIINLRGGTRVSVWAPPRNAPPLRHSASTNLAKQPSVASIDEEALLAEAFPARKSRTSSVTPSRPASPTASNHTDAQQPPHHHHVPKNAFLSISLQTSIAIALHKLPEGFITYATNHANPTLGFTVFLALAIHNISEGFALALPLYLATSSRPRALLYTFLLGGLSQPLGAAVAAIWLKIAERGRGDYAPTEAVYGAMFAATAGIMASVALSLLRESLELGHEKGWCMAFAFLGMGVLGVSSALTA